MYILLPSTTKVLQRIVSTRNCGANVSISTRTPDQTALRLD